MSKKSRLNEIINLITEFEIGTQEELTDILLNKGYDVSQSTVSRDIKELNLIKVECADKKYKYAKPVVSEEELSPQTVSLLKHIILSIDSANNLIVIKTLSGNAGAAGMAIDNMQFPQVLGTVAGDDTLLIITKTNADAEIILKSLRTL